MTGQESIVVAGKVEVCTIVGEERTSVRPGDVLIATGWIIAADSPIEQVWVTVDGVRSSPGSKGYERRDVADVYERPDARFSGFRAILTVDGLGTGSHQITVEAMDAQGRFLRGDGQPYVFEIVDDGAAVIGKIESVVVDGVEVGTDGPIEIRPDSVVSLSGWAISSEWRCGIAAFLRGDRFVSLGYGAERPDIAERFGESTMYAGFEGTVDTARFLPDGGRYGVVLIAPDGRSLIASDMVLDVVVAASSVPARRTLRVSGGV